MDQEWSERDLMADDVYARVGATIRSLRGRACMTQASLAKEAGFSRSSLTNIENGGQAILLHQLLDVAKALKIDPCELLIDVAGDSGNATIAPIPGRVAELLDRLDQPVATGRRR